MHRVLLFVLVSLIAVASASSLIVAGAAGSGSGTAAEQLRTTCEQQRFGSTYITSLKQRNTKCSTAKKVARKFTECRKDNGGKKGHCNETVAHYKCNEGKRSTQPGIQFSSKVKCERGSNKVIFTQTQNL